MTSTNSHDELRIERSVPEDIGYLDASVFTDIGMVQTVSVGNMIYLSGIAPLRGGSPEFDLAGGTFVEQLQFILDVLDRSLEAAGANRCDLVAWTIYTTDVTALSASAPILRDWVGAHPPTSTWVGVSTLIHPAQLLELTAIAAL